MKIVIIGPASTGGGSGRARMYEAFFRARNHDVTVIPFPGTSLASKTWYYYQRGRARFGGHQERHMKKTADLMEKRIQKEKYEAVICVETQCAYVLTRNLNCLKIFSCESLEADELYFAGSADLSDVHKVREMELEIFNKSNYVLFPWKSTENYVRKYIYNGSNLMTVPYGCTPRDKTALSFFPASIVSLGNLECYWSNPELLSQLTHLSPYRIDVFGKYKPPRRLNLKYKGYAPSLDILANYQFGLNTISKDIFRQNHFSSRVLTYLEYGLPVLSPDWMQLSHDLKGVLPYNENNFLEILEKYSDPEEWSKKSVEAHEQAVELDRKQVLKPLERITNSP